MDQVGNGLGLGEVDPAVQEGAPCEFTRFGMPGPAGEDAGENLAGNDRPTMATDFDDILPGERARSSEDGQQHFVDPTLSVDDMAVKHGVGGGSRRDRLVAAGWLEAGVGNGEGGPARNAEDCEPTRAGRGGDRGDGIRRVHGARSVAASASFGIDSFEEEAGLLVGTTVQVVEKVWIRAGRQGTGESGEIGQDGDDVPPAGGGGVELPELFQDGAFRFGHGEWLAASLRMVIRNLWQSRRVGASRHCPCLRKGTGRRRPHRLGKRL